MYKLVDIHMHEVGNPEVDSRPACFKCNAQRIYSILDFSLFPSSGPRPDPTRGSSGLVEFSELRLKMDL